MFHVVGVTAEQEITIRPALLDWDALADEYTSYGVAREATEHAYLHDGRDYRHALAWEQNITERINGLLTTPLTPGEARQLAAALTTAAGNAEQALLEEANQ